MKRTFTPSRRISRNACRRRRDSLSEESHPRLTIFHTVDMLTRKMQFPLATGFVDKESRAQVSGFIHTAVEEHLLSWTSWRYRSYDEDRTWDWWSIFQECKLSGGRLECFAALAAGNLQGLVALDLSGKRTKTGAVIIVDYLATNPANRIAGRGLKYVGIGLIAVALARSIECGASGRIWLESLPGAASFYEGLGMTRQPRRTAEGNLVYALDATTAEQLLAEIKAKGIVEL